ncbi:MAG: PilZ domain-containing protein [Alphaproteobacteria bacterium]|nr:PilZ domain-containing protein [Alphaproteobacteria bacterium]
MLLLCDAVNLPLTFTGVKRRVAQESVFRAGGGMTLDREALVAKAAEERRRYRRVRVNFKGRLFVPGEEREAGCTIVDMSPGGAQVACEIVPEAQSSIVLYIDGFGRFEGVVARSGKPEGTESSFAVRFNCPQFKRERVAEQLTLYLNNGTIDETAMRRHERAPTKGLTRFTRSNGDVVNCEVLDLSLSGVSVVTDVRPQIGELVLMGQMAGRVVRIHERGIAIEFVTPPPEKATPEQLVPKVSAQR